jgi:hypothetical protein
VPKALIITAVNFMFSNIIPFFLMLSSTISILHHLVTKKMRMRQDRINYNREREFVKSVLTMDLWFIVCYSPLCIMDLLQYIVSKDVMFNDYWNIFHDISVLLAMINTSLNFFVLLACNKLFKNEFNTIVCRGRFTQVKPMSDS